MMPPPTAFRSTRTTTAKLFVPFLLLLLTVLSYITPVLGIQKDLVGIVDWHKPLIGEPLLEPTPPRIIPALRSTNGSDGSGDALAGLKGDTWWVGITRRNVLAVLDVEDGSIVWRQILADNDPVVSYHVQDDTILLLSGPGASTARLFSLTTGHVLWEQHLLPPAQGSMGRLTTPVYLGTDASYAEPGHGDTGHGSFVILSEGRRVTRLRKEDGAVMWSTEAPGAGSTILFKQLLPSGSSLHVLALHYSFDMQTLLTSTMGLEIPIPKGDLGVVPSIVTVPEQAMIVSSHEEGRAKVVWAEHGRIRATLVREDGSLGDTKDFLPGNGRLYSDIIDVGLRHKGVVLGRRGDRGVDVLDIASGFKVVDFEHSRDSPENSQSIYSGAATKNGVILNRAYRSIVSEVGVVQTIHIPTIGSAETTTSGFTFPYDASSHGVFSHAAIAPYLDSNKNTNGVLFTSSGAIQRLSSETPAWTREESLADVQAVRFVDLGEPEVEEVREVLAEEGFIHRLFRHLVELKDLPAYLFRFAKRLTTASYTSAIGIIPLNTTHLHRDLFGFQKLLVAVTSKGKLFALDSANGAVVWSRNLGVTDENGAQLAIEGLWNVRDGEGGREPTLAVIAVKTSKKDATTVGFHVNAYTGEVAGDIDLETGLSEGTTLFSGTPKAIFPLPFENCGTKNRVLAIVDQKDQLHVFPSCKKVASDLLAIKHELSFTTTSRSIDGTILKGHVPSKLKEGTTFDTEVLWSHPFTEHERLLEIEPIIFEAIASFGRVLGDKSTLYKYLNPHLLAISTIQKKTASEEVVGRIYVIDSTNGQVVYATEIEDVVDHSEIKVKMVENWLVFSWLGTRGWKLGSVEIYEDTQGGKGVTPAVSTFAGSPKLQIFEQTFVLPTNVKTLGFTTSKAGIAVKELIVVNGKNQVITVPRRLLDPRRPLGKPTSRDKEEFLIPYDALIPIDPKRVVSHNYDVIGTTHLSTSPALVESTSLLVAYGLDIFLTRGTTPSGSFDILSDSFNKAQLLLTLGVLSAGIAVAGPAVKRKDLRMKWY